MNTKVFVLLMATAGAVGLVECGCPVGLFPVSGKVPEKGEPAFAQTRDPRSFKLTDEAPEPVLTGSRDATSTSANPDPCWRLASVQPSEALRTRGFMRERGNKSEIADGVSEFK
jgi:hypothetical protein